MQISERTRIKNHPERAVPEEAAEILSAGLVAHVGFIEDGLPYVIPLSYHYDSEQSDRLYLHGSIRSRALELSGQRRAGMRHSHADRRAGVLAQGDEPLHELPQRGAVRHRPRGDRPRREVRALRPNGAALLPRPAAGARLQPAAGIRPGRYRPGGGADRGVERQGPTRRPHRAGRRQSPTLPARRATPPSGSFSKR